MPSHTPTAFQLRVYAAVRRIPRGKVASYAAVAGAIGCRSARVVGQALRRCEDTNVPCHRVVAADCTLGGFAGRASGPDIARKRRLLIAEGVKFDREGRITARQVLHDSPAVCAALGDPRS